MNTGEFSNLINELQTVVSAPSTIAVQESKTDVSSKKAVQLLLVSTHVNQVNGYSKVAYGLIRQLSAIPWIELTHFGIQGLAEGNIGRTYPNNVAVIDGTKMEKKASGGFAFAELPAVIASKKPDIVLFYNDIAIISTYIEEIRKQNISRTFKIWAYIDQIYPNQPQGMLDIINRDVERIFCFTSYWKKLIKEQGLTRPCDVLNHGFDSVMFKPIPKDMARQALNIPKDAFVFTSVNRNQPRKRYDILIMAFVELIVRHPIKPIFLLITTDRGQRGGYQLFDIFARELKIHNASTEVFGNRLLVTSGDSIFKDSDINVFYNLADAGVSTADAEGFGLCSFEQMGVGVPQIVPELGGFTEYCNSSNSILVKPKHRYYMPQIYNPIAGEGFAVDPYEFSMAMEKYVFDENIRKAHAKNAKETVNKYTWEKVVEPLIKRLKQFQEDEE